MKLILAVLLLSLTTTISYAQSAFITKWNTGSGTTLRFPGVGTNYTIVVKNSLGTVVHTSTSVTRAVGTPYIIPSLTTNTEYTVEVTNGSGIFQQFHAPSSTDITKLREVKQWGTTAWITMRSAFSGATNMQVTATDTPILPNDVGYMFSECTALTGNAVFNTWNMTNVRNMEAMFFSASNFNTPLSAWNTSNVTNMHSVFEYASTFNQNINTWQTGNVTDMSQMFHGATLFNTPLNSWRTDNVITMHGMFEAATSFNQPINANIVPGAWNTSNVKIMSRMFAEASHFDQPIGGWNTSSATTMEAMFHKATIFNQPIGTWVTNNVTTMRDMFSYASTFNQPIDSWITSNVVTMETMFAVATSFNQPLNSWLTSNVANMYGMFAYAATFNQPLNNWNTSAATTMNGMFAYASAFNQNIGMWNLSNVANMELMLSFSGLNCINYSNTLIGWAGAATTPNNLNLGAHLLTHGNAALPAINTLTTTKGWNIMGGAGSCEIPLPVQLLFFNASLQDKNVKLIWSTASENNNKGFNIQKSKDGVNWENIAFVNTKVAGGNTTIKQDYSFTDNQPYANKTYYRLQQIDFDGKSEFSNTKYVTLGSNIQYHLFPNPTKDVLNITGLAGTETIIIYDVAGRMIKQIKNTNTIQTIPLNTMQAGIYNIQIIAANGTSTSHKVIKTK